MTPPRHRHTPKQPGSQPKRPPGLLRRLGAIAYDSLLLLAILFFATGILIPLNHGEAFTSEQIFYPVYLLLISFVFFGWFWTHGGQTLGMRAWKIIVLSEDGHPITWRQAALRFVCALLSWACLGLGFLWILIDKDRKAWHDRLSKTAVFFRYPNLS